MTHFGAILLFRRGVKQQYGSEVGNRYSNRYPIPGSVMR